MADYGEVYDAGFWSQLTAPPHRDLMTAMGYSLAKETGAKTMADVGCGLGDLMVGFAHFLDRESPVSPSWTNAEIVFGIDHPESRIGIEGGGKPYQLLDLDAPDAPERIVPKDRDLAVCVELAEHLKPESGPNLVRILTDLAPLVWFSGAMEGQNGTGHINERPPQYWEAQFRRRGYVPDWETTTRIRDGYQEKVAGEWWYRRCLLFRRT